MGTSTNAHLFYGYELGSEHGGWKLRNVAKDQEWLPAWLWLSVPESDDFKINPNYAFYGEKALNAANADKGITWETHCSAEYPEYVLSAYTFTAYRGSPKFLDHDVLAMIRNSKAVNDRLDRALEVLDIQPVQARPYWILASYWG